MFPRQQSVRDKVVLVTGASSGIGRAVAARLAAAGATVVTCSRDGERLRAAARRWPGHIEPVPCDLTDPRQREELVAGVVARHGRLDALVNNAGQGRVGLLTDLDADAIRDMVDLNVTAVADLTRLALPHLAAGGGDVVMISSLAGRVPVPPLSMYSATKAAVDGLVHALRRETPADVRVHNVNPGPVRTEWLLRAAIPHPTDDEGRRAHSFGVRPEQVADAVHDCLTRGHQGTRTVPRYLALARLAAVPPLRQAVNLALTPVAPLLARWTHRYRDRLVDRAHQDHPRTGD